MSKVRIHTVVFFLDDTEKEVKALDNVQCPSPVLFTPWIPFQNSCYNFIIAKTEYTATPPDEVHSKCQKMSKYLMWPLCICSLKNKSHLRCVINISN